MTPERLNDLAGRLWVDGDLSLEEERSLGRELQNSPEARRLLLSHFRLEGAILEHARSRLLSAPSPVRHPAVLRRKSTTNRASLAAWVSVLAAAGVVLAFLLFAVLRPKPAPLARSVRPDPGLTPAAPEAPEIPAPTSPAPARTPETPVPARAPNDPVDAPQPNLLSPAPNPLPAAPESPPAVTDGTRASDAVTADVLIERTEGDVLLVSARGKTPAKAGDSVPAGQGLETGSGKTLAVLSFADGTRMEARADTLLRDIRQKGPGAGKTGIALFLQHGSVWAQVRPQPAERPLVVQSPRGEVQVLGTVFTLRMDPDPKGLLRLDVQDGKVRFTRSSDGRVVDVGTGHSVSSGQSADLIVVRSQEIVQSFQDGRYPTADYSGTRDTQLVEKAPQTNFGGAKTLLTEAEDPREKRKDSWPLLRWDLAAVPVGSRVHSASITLHIVEPARGQAFYFFEPARTWSEMEATWKVASSGNLWRFPGSLGGVERWPAPLGTLSPLQKGEYTAMLAEGGIALVQSWINAPAGNLGVQIAGSSPSAGFHFHSREAASPESRPRLTIVYAPRQGK
ncbi:MAG TPA: DNRLRE domain-containing protein [Planctomycetota bacterium]|nr:DNRLRE domain-containing protein [Planctomycetota bacterium]